jgi:hypothetical protein
MPGKGLLILRLAVSSFLVHASFVPLIRLTTQDGYAALPIAAAVAGILLLLGLWTPVAGSLAALLELGVAFLGTRGSWAPVLGAAIGDRRVGSQTSALLLR